MFRARFFLRVFLLSALLSSIIQIAGCRGINGIQNIQEAKAASAPQITFTASPNSVSPNGSATLMWNITGAVTATIDGKGNIGETGSMTVNPTSTTTYTLRAEGPGGNSQATATVTVAGNAFTFTAAPAQIVPGDSATLSWNAANETSVSIDNNVGTFGPTGSMSVSPTVTTTYNATATGPAGTMTAVARVIVGTIAIQQFTANPASIGSGSASTLTWNVKGADSISIDNGVGNVTASGTANVSPTSTTTYTLTATHSGQTQTATVTVTVNSGVTIQFSANPNNISAGQSSTLSWATANATSVNI